jgi:hypothetical protein
MYGTPFTPRTLTPRWILAFAFQVRIFLEVLILLEIFNHGERDEMIEKTYGGVPDRKRPLFEESESTGEVRAEAHICASIRTQFDSFPLRPDLVHAMDLTVVSNWTRC